MRVSMAVGFGTTSIHELVDLAGALERGGFEEVLVEEAWREPVVPLTALTLGTDRIRLGTGIAQIFPVNPIVVAQQAAQVQELAGGRFSLGLGVGADFVIERWFGVTYERPLTRMREFVTVVRGVLQSPETGPFSYDGSVFGIRKYQLRFAEQAVDVPIRIAAVGPKMQELAGELADGVIVGALHSEGYMDHLRERLRTGAERAGRGVDDVEINFFVPCAVDVDEERARELARATIVYTAQYPHYRKVLESEGFGAEANRIAELAREHRHPEAQAVVTDQMLERFVVAGTIDQCRDQLARYADYPGMPVLFTVPFGVDESETLRSLRLIADHLDPLGQAVKDPCRNEH